MVNGKLCIAPDATTGTEVIFTVLDGDIRRTESIPTMNVVCLTHHHGPGLESCADFAT